MKKMIIVGAGGFGRELLWWIKDINKVNKTWEILGFIDDDIHALDKYECDYDIIGTISDWQPKDDEVFALAIGSPATKRIIVEKLKAKGASFATIIHPTAALSEFAKVGEGLIMFPHSKISCNSVVGDFVTLLATPIGHDNVIGDYTVISGGCNIVRNVQIGHDVFIAAGVCIAQDVHIGNNAYLGLGSVVLKDVPDGATVFGNPARVLPTK
ncbi:MAG: acetyltransferase [Erysipelotrichaceae bacterium]|jgi:sugar O-acyltransferase (sialic acid O-acetyltransferase NeuD family)|nr:acetyltransferase [Erysipelotrichaceae bacterium]